MHYNWVIKQKGDTLLKKINDKIFCPLLNKKIDEGYCWELCNIGTDEILLEGDAIKDWNKAHEICVECGRFFDE